MCIRLGDDFARYSRDVVISLTRVACPTTPLSVAIAPSQKRLVAAFIGGALASALPTALAHAQGYPAKFDFGTTATEQEIATVAIAIPADGKGLPPGKGDYASGMT